MERLRSTTPITDFSPGSIARAFIDTFAGEISSLYSAIDINLSMTRLSTARGEFLDLIGSMLGVQRWAGESDDNYRYRIAHRWETAATSNEIAVRLAALAVPGVRDVVIKPYVLGSGSFAIYPVPEPGYSPADLISPLEEAMRQVAAYGTRYIVTLGEEIPLAVDIEILFDPTTPASTQEQLLRLARDTVGRYIESLGLGGPFIISQVIHRIMELDNQSQKKIRDVKVTGLEIDSMPAIIDNAYPEWDERYIPVRIDVRAA